MSVKPPFTDLDVKTKTSGFYEGHSLEIALLSKGIMVALVLWALIWPANANGTLSASTSSFSKSSTGFTSPLSVCFSFSCLLSR